MRNIGSIINEEVQKFINESELVKDSRLKFAQNVNTKFGNYESFSSDYDTNINDSIISVYWELEFWINPRGVINSDVEINKVEGNYILQLLDKQTDEVKQETPKNIAEIKWNFEIDDFVIKHNGGLWIKELYFDFKNKTCKVLF
jgi:hypothetical protein